MVIEILGAIKDVVLTATAVIGSIVALKGLSTWKRQITGQANHSLSKNLLISIFKYRDAVNAVRNPLMPITQESLPEENEMLKMSPNETHFYSIRKSYQQRWEKVSETQPQVYANLIEAEAIWGKDLITMWKSVREKEIDLRLALDDYLMLINPNKDDDQNHKSGEEYKKLLKTVYWSGKNDVFREEFESKIDNMSAYIREKLQG
ncbi:MAG: hypothetical protein E6560_14860 [Yersiniaceae bacterium]|nr:hypothetical protein [Yersiniaceae bacterium]